MTTTTTDPTPIETHGAIVETAAVHAWASQGPLACLLFVMSSLRRHLIGDDGDLGDGEAGDEDRASNETARKTSTARVLSSYNIPRELAPDNGEKKLWIITDFAGDDTVTTVLFPGDY